MAYTPTQWNTGDTITASAMNKLENGVANAGGVMIVTSSTRNGAQTMDKTVQEIYDALMSGTPVYYKWNYGVPLDYHSNTWLAPISYIYTYTDNVFRVCVSRPSQIGGNGTLGYQMFQPSVMIFEANSINSYPAFLKQIRPSVDSLQSFTDFY